MPGKDTWSLNPLFDAVIVVDWSASKVPKTGADSIWWAEARQHRGGPRLAAVGNPATRFETLKILTERLQRHVDRGRRVLIGFDFPNGYPVGFAKAAGFTKTGQPAWRAIWRGLSGLIEDGPDNANNRFEVAGELNRRISGADYSFWGLPVKASHRHISPRKPVSAAGYPPLNERRLSEIWVPRAKSCWQLCYNGSVGSQSLVGIPIQNALRFDSPFSDQVRVWPFETGLQPPGADARIVIAEIYPSLIPLGRVAGRVKDEKQVKASALCFARRDLSGNLAADFAGPSELTVGQRRQIIKEESWILGAGTAFRPKIFS